MLIIIVLTALAASAGLAEVVIHRDARTRMAAGTYPTPLTPYDRVELGTHFTIPTFR